MFNTWIIAQDETDSSVQTSDQIIQVFALFTFSSSHHETKYITQLIIKAITAIKATFLINSDINIDICHNSVVLVGLLVSQKGKNQQLINGSANVTGNTNIQRRRIMNNFLIISIKYKQLN